MPVTSVKLTQPSNPPASFLTPHQKKSLTLFVVGILIGMVALACYLKGVSSATMITCGFGSVLWILSTVLYYLLEAPPMYPVQAKIQTKNQAKSKEASLTTP